MTKPPLPDTPGRFNPKVPPSVAPSTVPPTATAQRRRTVIAVTDGKRDRAPEQA